MRKRISRFSIHFLFGCNLFILLIKENKTSRILFVSVLKRWYYTNILSDELLVLPTVYLYK